MKRLAFVIAIAACGNGPDRPSSGHDASTGDIDGAGSDAGDMHDAAMGDAFVTTPDAPADAPAFPSTLDLHINCRNDCVLVANPSSISVPAGTEFDVNWINTGDTDCDVAKVDQFNQVPIIIGLQPGTSYHDTVRKWCGMFTGTFNFRVTICTIHSFIPVDCSAP